MAEPAASAPEAASAWKASRRDAVSGCASRAGAWVRAASAKEVGVEASSVTMVIGPQRSSDASSLAHTSTFAAHAGESGGTGLDAEEAAEAARRGFFGVASGAADSGAAEGVSVVLAAAASGWSGAESPALAGRLRAEEREGVAVASAGSEGCCEAAGVAAEEARSMGESEGGAISALTAGTGSVATAFEGENAVSDIPVQQLSCSGRANAYEISWDEATMGVLPGNRNSAKTNWLWRKYFASKYFKSKNTGIPVDYQIPLVVCRER